MVTLTWGEIMKLLLDKTIEQYLKDRGTGLGGGGSAAAPKNDLIRIIEKNVDEWGKEPERTREPADNLVGKIIEQYLKDRGTGLGGGGSSAPNIDNYLIRRIIEKNLDEWGREFA